MTKIEYRTLNDLAYDRIREGLMAGSFHPGQVLVIRSLAESYGISTTPVREALQRLVAERLLAALPNRSIAVPALEAGKYVELARIRCELEGLAAELAAPRLKKAALRRLVRLADDMDESLSAHDHDAYRRQNQAFHLGVYDEAASPRLFQMIQDLWSQTGPYMKELFGAPGYEPRANEAHRAILRALEAGDGAGARAGVVADLTVAGGFLIPHLERVEAARRREAALA